MKMKNLLWIGMAAVMGVVISLAWVACRQMPNQDKSASLRLNINVPDQPGQPDGGEVGIQAAAPTYIYHVKITLTNPDETFYVYNYVLGVPASLRVASGSGRVLNVELYEVDNPVIGSDYVPAYHYLISEPVTLNLTGAPTSVTVDVDSDPSPPVSLVSGLPHLVQEGTTTTIPLDPHCPFNSYSAYINDAFFGLTFPRIQVGLFDGSSPPNQTPLNIGNLLQDRFYFIEVRNDLAGIYAGFTVSTGDTTTVVSAPPLLFKGFNPNRSIVFSPNKITNVTPGDTVQVSFSIHGGWGSATPYSAYYISGYDSCGGQEMSAGVWTTDSINRTVCVISLYAQDCDGSDAEGSMNVYTAMTPTCNKDGYCDPGSGEDNKNCPHDCFCGDHDIFGSPVCFPPYENADTCMTDCGAF